LQWGIVSFLSLTLPEGRKRKSALLLQTKSDRDTGVAVSFLHGREKEGRGEKGGLFLYLLQRKEERAAKERSACRLATFGEGKKGKKKDTPQSLTSFPGWSGKKGRDFREKESLRIFLFCTLGDREKEKVKVKYRERDGHFPPLTPAGKKGKKKGESSLNLQNPEQEGKKRGRFGGGGVIPRIQHQKKKKRGGKFSSRPVEEKKKRSEKKKEMSTIEQATFY